MYNPPTHVTSVPCGPRSVILDTGERVTLTHALYCGEYTYGHRAETRTGVRTVLAGEWGKGLAIPEPPRGWMLSEGMGR